MAGKSKANIRARLMLWPLLVSLFSAGLAAFFLIVLIRFTHDQLKAFLLCLSVMFPVFFTLSRLGLQPRENDIARVWKLHQAGQKLTDPGEIRRCYSHVINHPRLLFLHGLFFWTTGTFVLAGYMAFVQGVSIYTFLKIGFAGTGAGTLSTFFLYHIAKAVLQPVRESFYTYRRVDDIAAGVKRISLRVKLLTTFVTLVIVTLTFSALMFYEHTVRVVETTRIDVSRPVFEAIRTDLSKLPVEDLRLVHFSSLARRAGMAPGFAAAVTDGQGKPIAFAGEEDLRRALFAGASGAAGASADRMRARRRLIEGAVPGRDWRLALYSHVGLAAREAAALYWTLALQLLLSIAIATGLAVLAANDVSHVLRDMGRWSRRVASGDLGSPLHVESEDELGRLAHSLSEMSDRLRGMIIHVRRTADRVEEASAGVAKDAGAVRAASDEQSSSVLEATSVFEQINASIRGIAEHTEHLSVSAEESSSSILEMGATVEEVSGNMESLGGSVDESVASMEEMTGTIREVARNVEGLSEVAEATGASMEEMAASVKQVDENALETQRLSVQMVKAAETGSDRVLATINGIEAIREASEEAKQVITSLGRRAEEIGEILNVIDEVAEETNLLALNAAIIAAQAGEHGRGFSVVADEIKDLAERVGASTKEIGKLIRAVQDESGNAISAVRRGGEMVAEGERLSRDAGMALEEITANARSSGEMIGEIAHAATEQAKGSQSVVVAMEQVRDMVSQIRGAMGEQTRGSDQVISASLSMRDVAQQVKGTIHEQVRGSGRITASIENIREMVQQINGAIQEQRRGTEQAVEALDQIRERAETNQDAAAKMASVVKGMVAQADELKTEVARFRLGGDPADNECAAGEAPPPEDEPAN
ncbi:MAG: methyl-accepting chemotaxis protein [Myxococcota bacterium]